MFEPGTVTYGFAKNINNPKYKYAISIFRDEDVQVVIHFTTSQRRAGVPDNQIKHGINRDADGKVVSYVFEPDVEIGDVPTGGRFCFPVRTVMQFDYGFLRGDDRSLQQQFEDLEVKCHLDREEYLNLVYAMYCSKRTPTEYKPYLEKVLHQLKSSALKSSIWFFSASFF